RAGQRAAEQRRVASRQRHDVDRKEAIAILGLKDGPQLTIRFTEAHRHIMIANYPDRGGSPYLASRINEANDSFEK
ncbi:hypothetical protein FOMPIDRAFT_1082749, partial [Fomitopsis schrenkii]